MNYEQRHTLQRESITTTCCYKLADPKRGCGQTCAVATLACTNIEVCECPSGQHARGFQMGFEPQLAGRLVYNSLLYDTLAEITAISLFKEHNNKPNQNTYEAKEYPYTYNLIC